jgi:predicted transcriptional regulator
MSLVGKLFGFGLRQTRRGVADDAAGELVDKEKALAAGLTE